MDALRPRFELSVPFPPAEVFTRRLFGFYGPSPSVWTAVLAAYASLGILALFGGMLGLVQLGLGMRPWGLVALPGAALLGVVPYLAAQVGQANAREQMHLMQCFLQAALGLAGLPATAPSPLCPAPAEGAAG